MDTRPGDRIAEEQAALRRVAVLVAGGAPPEEIFTAVTAEVERLMDADLTAMARYETDGAITHVARGTAAEDDREAGLRTLLGGQNLATVVLQTGRPARIDRSQVSGAPADIIQRLGIRSTVAAPVSVAGRLWGLMLVSTTSAEPFPAGTEARLMGFTELVGTAIASAQARVELRGYAEEQAALRRVATLVASGASPEEVFAAVAAEAGGLLGADVTAVGRYDADGVMTLGAWSSTGAPMPFAVGTRAGLGGQNLITLVFRTGRPVRMDDYGGATGAGADVGRGWGFRAAVGVPIRVEGRLWGVMAVGPTREKSLPADAEARLAGFTELVGTAIANAQARVELRGYAEEQAALRRVATLVARAAPPEDVFAAVTEEIGRVLGADITGMERYDPDGRATAVGMWSAAGCALAIAVGDRMILGGRNVTTLVRQTSQPARIDDYGDSSGEPAAAARGSGMRSSIGMPVSVGGRLWGVVTVGFTHEGTLPAGTEARLAGFTELVGTAIANAEVQGALAASRVRIVTTADETRRRIERDLHDGAQQRLVSLGLSLRELQAAVPPEAGDLARGLDGVATGLDAALEELREIARGIHPALLANGGLRPALKALARRCPVPVRLRVDIPDRVPGSLGAPDSVEIAAYYVVCEALTNTARHAQASAAEVEVTGCQGILRVCVRDDGRGGAYFGRGSGLAGLRDRVEALGGKIWLDSPPGKGTSLWVHLPAMAPARFGRGERSFT